jgi:hypothetical protein
VGLDSTLLCWCVRLQSLGRYKQDSLHRVFVGLKSTMLYWCVGIPARAIMARHTVSAAYWESDWSRLHQTRQCWWVSALSLFRAACHRTVVNSIHTLCDILASQGGDYTKTAFLNVMLRSLVHICRRFGETWRLYFHDSILCPEEGSNLSFRNLSYFLPDFTVSQPRKLYSPQQNPAHTPRSTSLRRILSSLQILLMNVLLNISDFFRACHKPHHIVLY